MKNWILNLLSRGEKVWLRRWHFYRWGYTKCPFEEFKPNFVLFDCKTGKRWEL